MSPVFKVLQRMRVVLQFVLAQGEHGMGWSGFRRDGYHARERCLRFWETVLIIEQRTQPPPSLIPGWSQPDRFAIKPDRFPHPVGRTCGIGLARDFCEIAGPGKWASRSGCGHQSKERDDQKHRRTIQRVAVLTTRCGGGSGFRKSISPQAPGSDVHTGPWLCRNQQARSHCRRNSV